MYEDSRIKLDDESLTIRTLRGQRMIVVPKTWFHWDWSRRNRSEALELEVGRFFKVGITPEDPDRLFAALDAHLAQT